MLKIVYKNFFLYFYHRFIKMFCMEKKFLTSFVVCVLCCPVYGFNELSTGHMSGLTHTYVIDTASDLESITGTLVSSDEIWIRGIDTYSLAVLDRSENAAATIVVSNENPNDSISFLVDTGFDRVFNPKLYKWTVADITLQNAYLNTVSGHDVVVFDDLHLDGNFTISDEDGENSTYRYPVERCSDGSGRWCIKRYTSTEYAITQQNAWHESQVVLRGAQNNPKVLLQPMMAVNQHELLGAYEFSDDVFMSVSPEYYNAKDFQNVGLRLNSGTKIGGRLSVGVGIYAARAAFQNDVSDFKSDVYGGNLRLNYDLDEMFFVRGVGGVSFSSIDCDGVKSGNGIVSNPNAIGLYGGADFGAKFNLESGIYLSPFVGVATLSNSVVDVHETDSFLHFGNDVGFKYFMDGVAYNYMLRVGVNSYGQVDASVGIGAWTIADKIGGSVSVGFIDTDFGWTGKFSANVRFAF